jgi:hypothetical protein
MTSKTNDFQKRALSEVIRQQKEEGEVPPKRKKKRRRYPFIDAAIEVRTKLRPHLEDPYFLHAATESYTYMCDMLSRLGIRYSHSAVMEMAKISFGLQAIRKHKDWHKYTKEEAPEVIEEILAMIAPPEEDGDAE